MANLGCRKFGKFLVSALAAAHAVNTLDLAYDKSFDNEDHE